MLVTISSDVAKGVGARSIAALDSKPNSVLGYIENMDGYFCRDCGRIKPLFPTQNSIQLALPRRGSGSCDPELAALCDSGGSVTGSSISGGSRPETPMSAARQPVRQIAREIDQRVTELGTAPFGTETFEEKS